MRRRILTTASSNERFLRQIPLIGEEGQERLARAKICIAGAGGLGSTIATYLAAAGVGSFRIIDNDIIEESNLNRQILYRIGDCGERKVDIATRAIRDLNPDATVEPVCSFIDAMTVNHLLTGADLVLDGMDNYPARYHLNRACLNLRIPYLHGAVNGFYGQATSVIPGETACLRCIIPRPPDKGKVPIIGVTCGVIGSIQATEAIKHITGSHAALAGRLLIWNGVQGDVDSIPTLRSPDCSDCKRYNPMDEKEEI
jgi:adenylyltransferase/sulfurtransferase